MSSLPLPEYLERLSTSDDPIQRTHALDVLALMDTEQGIERFSQRCLAVPLVQIQDQWRLAESVEVEPILALLAHDQALAGLDTSGPQERLVQLLGAFKDALSPSEPLLPVMMVADARWLLFYQQDLFPSGENTEHSFARAYASGHPLAALVLLGSQGDPIGWFYDRLSKRQQESEVQTMADIDAGCTPEFLD